MNNYEVIYSIKRTVVVEADNPDAAELQVCNLDPETAGDYVEDSFEMLETHGIRKGR